MLASQRQAVILAEVQRPGAVRVGDLVDPARRVRHDRAAGPRRVADRGLVEKVHGGATAPPARSVDEPGFVAKRLRARREGGHRGAAARWSARGRRRDVGGTTTWALAHLLRDVGRLTVVTNSMRGRRRMLASDRSDQTVVLTGGIRTPSDALVGPVAVRRCAASTSTWCSSACTGCRDDRVHHTQPDGSDTDRALVESARRLVVVADHTKWGVVGLSSIAPLHAADVLVTDDRLPEQARAVLREHVAEVVVAHAATPAQTGGRDMRARP